ncbi:ABC transporter permease subunit [Sporosarcina luteola]|uniref:ABC transporter permease subunit n=1 Tax=Sporosarcina luteola TaxID=582850 RepID=UPI002040E7F5|nr:ABC transporter permease subunit [Sporosarcina luteola]MCM3710630.1 ABC transporter permease [Sporosarcina luteola]
MSLLKFELKKIWRQKKLIWLLMLVTLCIGWIYYQNSMEQDLMAKEAEENIAFIVRQSDELYTQLLPLNRENRLTEEQTKQFDSLNNMAQSLFLWKSAIYGGRWEEIPQFENDFLVNLERYEDAGGVFTALTGVQRDMAIEKNAYLLEHGLPYANETYPVTPALQMGEIAPILLGPGGLLLLLLLFGNAYTSEKEQQTLLTLRTQPLRRGKLLTAKYISLLVVLFFFFAATILIGWAIPHFFGEPFNDLSYPQFLQTGDAFTIIPAWQHLANVTVLFLAAAAVLFGLLLVISTQLRSSFSTIMFIGFVTMLGVVLTEAVKGFQAPWNPFQFFRADRFLTEMPIHSIWQYAISAIVWSVILVIASVLLREGERGIFKAAEELKPYRKGQTTRLQSVWNNGLFEWRKSRRRGLIEQTFVVLSVAAFVGYLFFAEQVKEQESMALNGLASLVERTETEIIPFYESRIQELEDKVAEANANGEDGDFIYGHNIPTYEGYIENAREEAKLAERALAVYEEGEWSAFYEYQLFNDNRIYEMQAEAKKHMHLPQSLFGYETSIAQKEWMKEHGVKPVFSGTYIPNIHDNWKTEQRKEKEWTERMNRKVDHSGLFSLYMYFRDYLYFIPLLIFLLLVGAGFAGERGKRPTLQLLKTLPITKRSLFLGKVFYSSIIATGSAVGIFLFAVLVGTVFNRFGDWMYPVLHYHSRHEVQSFDYSGLRAFEGGYSFLPLGEFLLKALLLYVCVALFVIALSNVLGLFIRQPLVVYALTGLINVAGYLLSWKLDDFAQYSPFLYLNIPKIVNGEILTLMNDPAISVYMGCGMLLGATVILLGVTYVGLSFEKRFVKERKSVTASV